MVRTQANGLARDRGQAAVELLRKSTVEPH